MKKFYSLLRQIIFFTTKILFSFTIFFYFFSKINFINYFTLLKNINVGFLLIGIFFFTLHFFFYVYKWKIFIKMLGIQNSYLTLAKITLVSFFYGLFLPGGFLAGETVKCYKIIKNQKQKLGLILSVFLDRLTGIIAFVSIGIVSLLFSGYDDLLITFLYFVLGILVAIFYLSLVIKKGHFMLSAGNMLLSFFKKTREKFAGQPQIQRAVIQRAVLIGVLTHLIIAVGIYFFWRALGQNILVIHMIWIYALVSILTMIPITFLGIGLRDFALIFLLSKFGFSATLSMGLATLIVFALFLRGIIGGVIEFYSFFKPSKRSDLDQ